MQYVVLLLSICLGLWEFMPNVNIVGFQGRVDAKTYIQPALFKQKALSYWVYSKPLSLPTTLSFVVLMSYLSHFTISFIQLFLLSLALLPTTHKIFCGLSTQDHGRTPSSYFSNYIYYFTDIFICIVTHFMYKILKYLQLK